MSPKQLGLLQGTLDVLVLQALASEPRHGYGVADWIRRASGGTLEIEDGALYTSLHRMARRGLLDATWGLSENNRRAKYYSLTAQGHKELEASTREWTLYAEAMAKVLAAGR